MSGQVVDFFSRQPVGKLRKENDKAAEDGEYLGSLPVADATNLRNMSQDVGRRRALVEQMLQDFNNYYTSYMQDLLRVLLFLSVDPQAFDPEHDLLYIGEDGHVWKVSRKGKHRFEDNLITLQLQEGETEDGRIDRMDGRTHEPDGAPEL